MTARNVASSLGSTVISSTGTFHLANVSRHSPLLHSQKQRPVSLVRSDGAGSLSAPILASAAIALSGSRMDVARPASRQARSEARKALQQLPSSGSAGKSFAGVSRLALRGSVLQLVARAFTAVGLIMQRAGVDDESMAVVRTVGLVTYMATAVPDMLSYLLAPRAVLMVLSSVEPLLVSVLAAVLLPRDAAVLTSRHSLATLLVVVGTLGCVLFSPNAKIGEVTTVPVGTTELWDNSMSTGAAKLFQPAGMHRLMLFLVVAVPVLICFAHKAHKNKMAKLYSSPSANIGVQLAFTAAMSLSLQRLALEMLGVSLHAVHWEVRFVLQTPAIIVTACLAIVCMLSCSYHVWQGIKEMPPHIFVPLYCGMSTLAQLLQSMAIMREFRDEPAEKMFLTLACAGVTFLGVVWLSKAPPAHKGMKFAASWFGQLPDSRQHDVNCLQPKFMAS